MSRNKWIGYRDVTDGDGSGMRHVSQTASEGLEWADAPREVRELVVEAFAAARRSVFGKETDEWAKQRDVSVMLVFIDEEHNYELSCYLWRELPGGELHLPRIAKVNVEPGTSAEDVVEWVEREMTRLKEEDAAWTLVDSPDLVADALADLASVSVQVLLVDRSDRVEVKVEWAKGKTLHAFAAADGSDFEQLVEGLREDLRSVIQG